MSVHQYRHVESSVLVTSTERLNSVSSTQNTTNTVLQQSYSLPGAPWPEFASMSADFPPKDALRRAEVTQHQKMQSDVNKPVA